MIYICILSIVGNIDTDNTDGNDENGLTLKDTDDNEFCDNLDNDDDCGANVDYDRGADAVLTMLK